MIETVIVPLNGSRHAETAIPYAVEQADHYHAKLVLLRVVPRPECLQSERCSRGGPAPTRPTWSQMEAIAAETEAARYLEDVRQRFGLSRRTELIVRIGDPFLRLRGEIKWQPHPLIVVTTGDPAATVQPYLSPMTRQLLAAGTAPVLAVHAPASMGMRPVEGVAMTGAPLPSASARPITEEDLFTMVNTADRAPTPAGLH